MICCMDTDDDHFHDLHGLTTGEHPLQMTTKSLMDLLGVLSYATILWRCLRCLLLGGICR